MKIYIQLFIIKCSYLKKKKKYLGKFKNEEDADGDIYY